MNEPAWVARDNEVSDEIWKMATAAALTKPCMPTQEVLDDMLVKYKEIVSEVLRKNPDFVATGSPRVDVLFDKIVFSSNIKSREEIEYCSAGLRRMIEESRSPVRTMSYAERDARSKEVADEISNALKDAGLLGHSGMFTTTAEFYEVLNTFDAIVEAALDRHTDFVCTSTPSLTYGEHGLVFSPNIVLREEVEEDEERTRKFAEKNRGGMGRCE